MPLKRGYKKRRRPRRVVAKVRRFNRKKGISATRANVKVTRSVPDRLFATLRFADISSVNVAGSGVIANVLSYRSSLNAPKSGSTHQPLSYDQYCPAMYGNYRVYGIKYNITVVNSRINDTWYAAVEHENEASLGAVTSLQTLMERSIAKVRIGGQQYSPSNRVHISGFMSVSKTLGLNKTSMTDNLFLAAYNQDPSRMANLTIYMSHNNPSTTAFDVIVRLTYYCSFENKAWLSAS